MTPSQIAIERLCRIACEECEKCAMGLDPECVNGYWRHGHDLCRAALTHARISEIEIATPEETGVDPETVAACSPNTLAEAKTK